MLLDQSECRNLGPETEASVFMRETSVVVIAPPPSPTTPQSAFDAHCRCEMNELRGLGERLRLSPPGVVDTFEMHYIHVRSSGQLLLNDSVFGPSAAAASTFKAPE